MLQSFVAATVCILIMDACWLSLNYKYHEKLFESVQNSPITVRLLPAALVYILIPLALCYFAIQPSTSGKDSLRRGSLLGLSMYGLYDLTNLSTLKGWTTEMTIKDTLWGTVVCGTASLVGFYFK
jgi:uncharacterized membrane protein